MKHIEEITKENFNQWVKMALALWPDNEENELKDEFHKMLSSKKEQAFIYKLDDEYIGFTNLSIRSDYVEGSSSSPVGYVEGIYVRTEYRNNGIAKELITKGEEWAKEKGCTQMGSDIELDNHISYKFHQKVGFKEANRIICFIKDI
ncbi:GNAT family N-acetyltransferase [Clostridium sp. Cult2]|nr:GNAT family N-acetyltransferase [Clostridium sp. Cult2]